MTTTTSSKLGEYLSGDGIPWTSRSLLLTTALVLILTWRATIIVYNLYFHPLRRFPGPLHRRASRIPHAFGNAFGTGIFEIQKLHDRYGPVVRIAPGHLSFTDPAAWNDIYGPIGKNKSGWPEMPKSRKFTTVVLGEPDSVASADFHEHQTVRRALSGGFSDASLRKMEPMLRRYTDLLVRRMREKSGGGGEAALNMAAFFNWATFDIIGDLVFGQSFRCLEKCEYHLYVAWLFSSIKAWTAFVSLCYLDQRWIIELLTKTVGQRSMDMIQKVMKGMMDERLAMPRGRDDLLEELIARREEWNMSDASITSNAFLLTIAGSETSATTLCGISYLLGTHPDAYRKLTDEIRSTFKTADDITISEVSRMPYLTAIINETLRMYPAVPANLVRIIPPEGKQIAGQYIPGGTMVEVQNWSSNHSEANFVDPWKFDPERWMGEREAGIKGNNNNNPEASQPFGYGTRNCIGRSLAQAEMRLILCRILLDFDMKLGEGMQGWMERQKSFHLWDRPALDIYYTPR